MDYPVSTRRYLRVTVYGWDDPGNVDTAFVSYSRELPVQREIAAYVNAPGEKAIDLGAPGVPHDALVFDVAPGLFSRQVDVETSTDAKKWSYAGHGSISRTANAESISFVFSESWDRYLRIHVLNHDDPPLQVRAVSVQGIVRRLRFQAGQPTPYWLYYGDADAVSPTYDLATVLPRDAGSQPATLGPQEANPEYRAPVKPITDQNPILLYSVMGCAILAMAYAAVRLLKKVQSETP